MDADTPGTSCDEVIVPERKLSVPDVLSLQNVLIYEKPPCFSVFFFFFLVRIPKKTVNVRRKLPDTNGLRGQHDMPVRV